MTWQLQEPRHVDEPREAHEYAEIFTRVATKKESVVVRREGADVVAIIPLVQLDVLREALLAEALAMEEVQQLARGIDWRRLAKENPPPQSWFDRDEPKPF